MKNSPCLMKNISLLYTQLVKTIPIFVNSKRNYVNTSEHFEPSNINWQWTPRCRPCFTCPNFCKSRKCPPKRFFPRWKQPMVPKDIKSCAEPQKKVPTLTNSSLAEFFSYLLPDSMQEEYQRATHVPAERCRVLAEIRRNKCTDPHSCLCCRHRSCPPNEWYDQAVIHTLIGGGVYPPEARPLCGSYRDVDPAPPPSFMVPPCVTNTKGLCKTPYKCQSANEALPFQEYVVPVKAPPAKVKPYKFKPKKKVYFMVPDVNQRAVRLSCKHYADFKTVECPPSLFTRYKSVVGSPPGPVEASCDTSSGARPQTEPPVCPESDFEKSRVRCFHTYLPRHLHSSPRLMVDDEDEEDRQKRCKMEKKRGRCDVIYNDIVENKKCIKKEPKDKCDKELFQNKKNDPCQSDCKKCKR